MALDFEGLQVRGGFAQPSMLATEAFLICTNDRTGKMESGGKFQ
jgi:hypothetical protein